MAHEPCSDIRLKMYADRTNQTSPVENKENKTPEGLSSRQNSFRGRGRGLLGVRQRLEERKKQRIRKLLYYNNIKQYSLFFSLVTLKFSWGCSRQCRVQFNFTNAKTIGSQLYTKHSQSAWIRYVISEFQNCKIISILVSLMKPTDFKPQNQTAKITPTDSGVYFDEIVDGLPDLNAGRPPPKPSQLNASLKNRNSGRFEGIRFVRGKETVQRSNNYATVQMNYQGPKERVGKEIPFNYDAAPSIIRRKDFHGVPMPIRDPQKEFESPTRFPKHRPGDYLDHTNSTFGQEIQHESHRFGLTNALWPIENRDSKLADFQPRMSNRDPQEISRIYADPRQADCAYKLQDRRSLSNAFRSDDQRRAKLVRTSKARRFVQCEYFCKSFF